MTEERKRERREDPKRAREQSETDDPTRKTTRQIDDNQDDMGRDVNDPRRVANEINKTGH
jgi:hypothetical protein